MQPLLILQVLFLLLVANGTPVLVKRVLGRRLAHPLDGGAKLFDGQRLLGPSKTVRGVVSSIGMTAVCAPLVGLGWTVGVLIGVTAMAGDLFSSFVKRRLRLAPSSRATGLDQVPESLFPLLAARAMLALTAADIVIGVVLFFVAEIVLSRVLFKLGVRTQPH